MALEARHAYYRGIHTENVNPYGVNHVRMKLEMAFYAIKDLGGMRFSSNNITLSSRRNRTTVRPCPCSNAGRGQEPSSSSSSSSKCWLVGAGMGSADHLTVRILRDHERRPFACMCAPRHTLVPNLEKEFSLVMRTACLDVACPACIAAPGGAPHQAGRCAHL